MKEAVWSGAVVAAVVLLGSASAFADRWAGLPGDTIRERS